MCFYCKAASTILDTLWEDTDLRDEFSELGTDLIGLGPLIHEVFVPAYLVVKHSIDRNGLAMLEAQVTEDLLSPFYDRPEFREIWDHWDEQTRKDFTHEQSEAELARLLLNFYEDHFAAAYKAAYKAYNNGGHGE